MPEVYYGAAAVEQDQRSEKDQICRGQSGQLRSRVLRGDSGIGLPNQTGRSCGGSPGHSREKLAVSEPTPDGIAEPTALALRGMGMVSEAESNTDQLKGDV